MEVYNSEKAKLAGIHAAMAHFKKFNGSDVSSAGDLSKELFEMYGNHFLLQSDFACGTMVQYLSGVFNYYKNKFPNLSLWTEDVVMNTNGSAPKWYLNIRNNIVRTMTDRVIQEGKKLQENQSQLVKN